MSDVGLIAIILAAFGFAIWVVRLLGRLIDSDGIDAQAEEPPDTNGSATAADPRRPR